MTAKSAALCIYVLICVFVTGASGDTNGTAETNRTITETISDHRPPFMVRNKPGYTAIVVLVSLALLFLSLGLAPKWPSLEACMVAWFLCACALVWFLTLYFVSLYTDHVHSYYKGTQATTVSASNRSYECTEIRNCRCAEAAPQAQSCDLAAMELLTNNTWASGCSNGYRCCREETYCAHMATSCSESCSGSGSSRSCSTSCYDYCVSYVTVCLEHVNNEACTAVRGTCMDMQVHVEFTYEGTPVVTQRMQHCGLNDTACVAEFTDTYMPLGHTNDIWFPPWDYSDFTFRRPGLAGWQIGLLVIPCLVFFTYVVIVLCLFANSIVRVLAHIWSALTSCAQSTRSALSVYALNIYDRARATLNELAPRPKTVLEKQAVQTYV